MWEIARTENGHRADGYQHSAEIGSWKGGAFGQGGIDAGVAPGAFAEQVGKELKLSDGSATLAGQPLEGKACFLMGAFEQRVAKSGYFACDCFEKDGAQFRGAPPEEGERLLRSLEGGLQQGVVCFLKEGLQRLSEQRIVSGEGYGTGGADCAGDEAFSVERHGWGRVWTRD